jgi:HEAT repeat protein
MDKNITRICGLLQSPDGMRRCAAAMVLAELAPREPQVVKALGDALREANQLLTRYILEAFEAISTRAVVPFVLPLLESPEMETKLRAAAIIARVGGDMVSDLARQFEKATPEQKRVLIDILARIHSRDSLRLILDVLFDPDFELVKEACQAVRRHMTDVTPKDRLAMHKQVAAFMGSARVRKEERVLTSCLLLIGYIGAPQAAPLLLQHTGTRFAASLRRNALIGLKGIPFAGAAAARVGRQLIGYLKEPDYANVPQSALDVIERLPLPGSFDAQWRKLLQSKHPSVRAFAARRLAATETAATDRLLVTLLDHEDQQIGEIAAGALARHKKAAPLLLAALAREKRAEPAWRLAKILKPHSESVDKATVRRFVALAAREIERHDPRAEALLYFLRNIRAGLADDVLRDTGLRFKKNGKWGRAIDCLKQLVRADGFDAGLRYELTVCNLKQSPKELTGHLRGEDHALKGLQTLLGDRKFGLLDRLKKEKALGAEEFFYAGFHFAEGLGEEQRFGQALLEHLAKRWSKSKEAKAAKTKLKTLQAGAAAPAAPAPAPAPR